MLTMIQQKRSLWQSGMDAFLYVKVGTLSIEYILLARVDSLMVSQPATSKRNNNGVVLVAGITLRMKSNLMCLYDRIVGAAGLSLRYHLTLSSSFTCAIR